MTVATELSREIRAELTKLCFPLPQFVKRCLVYGLQCKVASTCRLHQRAFLFVNLFSQGNDIIVNPLELGVHIALVLDNVARRLQAGGGRDVPHLFHQVGGGIVRCASLGAQSSKVSP
jgi:hypothetical protein